MQPSYLIPSLYTEQQNWETALSFVTPGEIVPTPTFPIPVCHFLILIELAYINQFFFC